MQSSPHSSLHLIARKNRYDREVEPCDWIVNDASVFDYLLSPQILNLVASPPGGEIKVRRLKTLSDYKFNSTSDGDANEEDRRQPMSHEFPSTELCRVLHVGCGNSQLGEFLLQSGFTDIVNVDYSEVVIKKSESRNRSRCCYVFLSVLSTITHTK
jgi:hypothetical protein